MRSKIENCAVPHLLKKAKCAAECGVNCHILGGGGGERHHHYLARCPLDKFEIRGLSDQLLKDQSSFRDKRKV